MPWNPLYKSAWRNFLIALAARYESNPAFVSISVAGPTASSEEMILPDNANTLPQEQFGGLLPNAMWLKLLAFHYPGRPAYQRSDQAFIDEWEAAIDMYGEIFSGVTLVATTGAGLSNLAARGFTVPSDFTAACPHPNMDCAAETTILSYFGKPTVGGAYRRRSSAEALRYAPDRATASDATRTILALNQRERQTRAPADPRNNPPVPAGHVMNRRPIPAERASNLAH